MHKYAAATTQAIALITMLALTVSALVTPAKARGENAWTPYCKWGAMISVRAGTPCVFKPYTVGMSRHSENYPPASIERPGPVVQSRGYWLYSLEIIEPPHNGTAVLRADGSIYYSPKPGFTGRDSVRVQRTGCNYSGTWHMDPFHDWCGYLTRTFAIFVE
jgi:hypothetical protein